MSDYITIHYISDGKEWATYLQDKFNSEGYSIKTVLRDFEASKSPTQGIVNIFLITPDLFEIENWDLMGHFKRDTSMVVLTGVNHADWTMGIKNESLADWKSYEVNEDEESVRGLIMTIVSLYESSQQIPFWPSSNNMEKSERRKKDKNNIEPCQRPDSISTLYAPLPKHSKPVNTVSHVFRQGSNVYILLEGTNSGEVKVKFHEGETVRAACVSEKGTLYSFPYKRAHRETFDVTLDNTDVAYNCVVEEVKPLSDSLDDDLFFPDRVSIASVPSKSSLRSTGSARFSETSNDDPPPPPPGGTFSCTANYVNINRTSSGRSTSSANSWEATASTRTSQASLSKLDQIQRLLKDETDPVNILCQSLNISNDIRELDERLTSMLQTTEALKQLSYQYPMDPVLEKSDSMCPTLLHFGAQYNLKGFCRALVGNPLTCSAALQKDRNGRFPSAVARDEGHFDLGDALQRVTRHLLIRILFGLQRANEDFQDTGTERAGVILEGDLGEKSAQAG